MDNFSHGTAGVAYYLVKFHEQHQHKKYLNAAIESTRILKSLTNNKGYISHHLPGGDSLYYLNWCHGPAGTNRLYHSLYVTTKEDRWRQKIVTSSNSMVSEGIDTLRKPGFWNNMGKCCGSASVAEYYAWLYDFTDNEDYMTFSYQMTELIQKNATEAENSLKWVHAENRVSPEVLTAQTGLMQGTAGIGLWFLELHARQNGTSPRILLPDKSMAL